VPGDEHRLLVVGGKVVAARAAKRVGHRRRQATVSQLIDTQINTDPRRGITEDFPLNASRSKTTTRCCSTWSARA
jgi:cyanophycin synthetase